MAGKIYTKVGDKGNTSLLGGQKVSKGNSKIDCYGSVDELNSVLGLVRAELATLKGKKFSELDADIEVLQHRLFDLGSLLASLEEDRKKFKLPEISEGHIHWLEKKIDVATSQMPELREFILPGGTKLAAYFHLSRTVARRAERALVLYSQSGMEEKDSIPTQAIPFLNRISDYLFVMARFSNFLLKTSDVKWKKSLNL